MTTNAYNYVYLPKIQFGDIRLLVVMTTDENKEKIHYSRLDIRYYNGDSPTSYGVRVDHDELLEVLKFIEAMKEKPQGEKSFGKIVMQDHGSLRLSKNNHFVIIKRDILDIFSIYIPGIAYLLKHLQDDKLTEAKSKLADFYIWHITRNVIDAPCNHKVYKPTKPSFKELKQIDGNMQRSWLMYINTFYHIPNGMIGEEEFKMKADGSYIETVKSIYNEEPRLLDSLGHVLDELPTINSEAIYAATS